MYRIVPFFIALQFLTRIPVSLTCAPSPKQIGQSILYYPMVGLVIGIVLAFLDAILANTNDLLRAAIILTTWIFITGALHLDGLADSADALVGGLGDKEKTLSIMEDPYCGPAAVVTLIAILLIKFSALVSISSTENLACLLTPIIARSTVLLLFLTTPYIQKEGIAQLLATQFSKTATIWVLIFTVAIIILLLNTKAFGLILGTCLVVFLLRNLMMKRLGGMTGDTIGATIVIAEAALLILFTL